MSYIDEEKISDLLNRTGKSRPLEVRNILRKALSLKGLSPEEASILICVSDEALLKELQYTARVVKQRYPREKVCFIGPCVGKKWESVRTEAIDYCLTFEEIAAIFVALNIDVSQMPETPLEEKSTRYGMGFPVSGGISTAIAVKVKEKSELEVNPYVINGVEDETLKMLQQIFPGANSYNLIEGIFCPESCCGGPGVLVPARSSRRKVEKAIDTQ